jgi:hypothetical protein
LIKSENEAFDHSIATGLSYPFLPVIKNHITGNFVQLFVFFLFFLPTSIKMNDNLVDILINDKNNFTIKKTGILLVILPVIKTISVKLKHLATINQKNLN